MTEIKLPMGYLAYATLVARRQDKAAVRALEELASRSPARWLIREQFEDGP